MRRLGRPIPALQLSAEERGALEHWARRPKTAQATALRARLILGCAAGKTNTLVAQELRVTKQTVGKWRSRFVAKRLDGLLDAPRPGAPRTVTDAAVERVVTWTLETTPRDATHWSTRAMARQCGLSIGAGPVTRANLTTLGVIGAQRASASSAHTRRRTAPETLP
jgi:transposase